MSEKTGFAREIPEEEIEWINGFAVPPSLPKRRLHGLASVIRLISNKEDTRQVFEIIQAVSGDSGRRLFKRFTDTPYGKRVISEPVRLEEVLSDREALRLMPAGSLGRAYLDFMEGENLTADGLLASAEEAGIDFSDDTQFEDYRRLFLHLQVSHDLWHVISGYGRDALGELCNLVFSKALTNNPGFGWIIFIGQFAQKLDQFSTPTFKALDEARRMSRGVQWLPGYDVEKLLPMKLSAVRAELNITEPAIYNAIPQAEKDALLKPKVDHTQTERELAKAGA